MPALQPFLTLDHQAHNISVPVSRGVAFYSGEARAWKAAFADASACAFIPVDEFTTEQEATAFVNQGLSGGVHVG